MATETIWVVPTKVDLIKVLSTELLVSNENVGEDNDLQNLQEIPFDPDKPDRRDAQLAFAVTEFRQAIVVGNKVPLSNLVSDPNDQTIPFPVGSLPPELVRLALVKAAYGVLSSAINLKAVLVTENGVYTPFNKLVDEANQMLNKLRAGLPVTYPSDPVTDPLLQAGASDDITGNWDMTLDGTTTPTAA
jgi:hypothetical protein